jgi:hypothetical protein
MLIQKVRSAIRARFFSPDITLRQQGRIVDASHQSMMRLNKRCDELMMDYPTIESLSDTELVNKLYPAVLQPTRSKRQPDIDTILEEFTKPRKKRKSRTMRELGLFTSKMAKRYRSRFLLLFWGRAKRFLHGQPWVKKPYIGLMA